MHNWIEDAAGAVLCAALYVGPLGVLIAGLELLLIVLLLAGWV
jgi:hypothetical protein